jgi:uncharacterized protein YndB with AHSA1/START domain
MEKITVETIVHADTKKVWDYFTSPEHVKGWCFASDDWGVGKVENDLRVGGKFLTHMMAKDGSAGFDFTGVYTRVDDSGYDYTMDGDGRKVTVTFSPVPGGVKVTETFDPENENPPEFQRQGWQAILDNFKKYAESH